jgi:hypothetical protein
MSFFDWLEYALVNFSAAVAIAIDACILVLLKFRDFSTMVVALQWASAVGLTHMLFPMIGFVGGWLVIEHYYHLAAGVYTLGASLLGVLIYLVVRESVGLHHEVGRVLTHNRTGSTNTLTFWISVIYVSLDALLSGPGKTVLLERYPKELARLSFLIVGLLVALFTFIAGGVSRSIHNRFIEGRIASPDSLAQGITVGVIGEIILFSFFLVWSLAKTIDYLPGFTRLDVPLSYVTLAGLIIGGTISAAFFRRIKTAQLMKAGLAVEGPRLPNS